jgi:hypothetical protein
MTNASHTTALREREFPEPETSLDDAKTVEVVSPSSHPVAANEHVVRTYEHRVNPLWAVNAALMGFLWFALMYLASR